MIHYQQMNELIDAGKISKNEINEILKHFNYR